MAFLAAALGLIWIVDARSPRVAGGVPTSAGRRTADLPFAASATDPAAAVSLQESPTSAVDSDAASADDLAQCDVVRNAPVEFIGRLFSCDNTVEPLPIAWRSSLGSDSSGDKVRTVLGQSADSFSRFRLTLFCRSRDLQTTAVQVYFDTETLNALPKLGSQTRVKLQLLGQSPTGQLVARYVGLLARPRPPPHKDSNRPDWLAMLLNPTAYLQRPQSCQVASWPRLMPASALAAESAALLPLQADGPFLQLTCLDPHDLEIPVLVYFQADKREDLLKIAVSSQLMLRVLGSADNRVVAKYVDIASGGVAAAPDDLRRLFGSAPDARSRSRAAIACVSMGLPLPETLTADERTATAKLAGDGFKVTLLAERKTWLVCAQSPRPSVHVTLFFPADAQRELLNIGRGTRLMLRPIGVQDQNIIGLFDKIVANPLAESVRSDDLRRFALLTDSLLHQKTRCQLGRALQKLDTNEFAQLLHGLFSQPMLQQPRLATCVDSVRPFEGQPFLVFWPVGPAAPDQWVDAGSAIELELVGLANNVPVAAFVRRLPPTPAAAQDTFGALGK